VKEEKKRDKGEGSVTTHLHTGGPKQKEKTEEIPLSLLGRVNL